MIHVLLKSGYTLPEALSLTLSDVDLFNEILDEDIKEEGLTEDFLSLFG